MTIDSQSWNHLPRRFSFISIDAPFSISYHSITHAFIRRRVLPFRYSQDEDHKRAINFFITALEIDPTFAEAYGFRGMAHFQLENYQAALDDFNNALALEPELENVHFYRALYFIKFKLYSQTIKDLNSAIEIDKYFADAYFYRGICKGMVDDLKGGTYD